MHGTNKHQCQYAPRKPSADIQVHAVLLPQTYSSLSHTESLPSSLCLNLSGMPSCSSTQTPRISVNAPSFSSPSVDDCGIKNLNYNLECKHIAGTPSGKQTYHIFYYLFADTLVEEQQYMQLIDKTLSQSLGQHGMSATHQNMRDDNTQYFEQLKSALKNIGFSKCHVMLTCQLITALPS